MRLNKPYNYRNDITKKKILNISRDILIDYNKNIKIGVLYRKISKELNCSIGPILRMYKYKELISKLNISEDMLYRKKNKINVNCKNCDKIFERYNSQVVKDNYCNQKCYHEYAKITQLGENNPNFGNKWSKEKREAFSVKQKEKYASGNIIPWSKGLNKEVDDRLKQLSKSIIECHKKIDNYGMKNKNHSDKIRQLMSQNHRLKNGFLPGNWQGGKSYEPYTLDFNKKIKRKIKERDMICLVCNISFDDLILLNRKIHIHHVDYDKKNSFPQNLVTLCNSCHSKTNANRNHWKTFFQSLLKDRYGYEYTQDQKIILDFTGVIK